MATVKVKQTIVGEYGRAKAGDTIEVKKSVGKQLVDQGVADWLDEEGEEPEVSKKGGVKITHTDAEGNKKVIHNTKSEPKETNKKEVEEEKKVEVKEEPKHTPVETKKPVTKEQPKKH